MKKLLAIALFVLSIGTSFAGTMVPRTINIKNIPLPTGSRPRPVPFTDDESLVFSLYATTDALELTSESAQGNAWISIIGPTGVVYSSMESMTIGSELTISVEDSPAGAYTISILYNATIYVGEFEVE